MGVGTGQPYRVAVGQIKTRFRAQFSSSDVMQITARYLRLAYYGEALGGGFMMTVRSPLDVLAIVFGLLLLVIVVIVGAILALAYRNSRRGFSYFAAEMATPRSSV